jgi:dolichyl-phosphate-mannose-protein mannosyltransferase
VRIKLRHIETDKALHSHDVRPPVSDVDFQNEVSAYGMAGFVGDANDDWYLEIAKGDKRDKESGKRLRTLRTHFRLRHALTGCYLFSHKVKLPEWGWEQQEVTCNKNAVMANSLWFVETSTHPLCMCYNSWLSDNRGIDGILQFLRMARKSTTDCLGSLPNSPSCSK